jgi:hypothetical protein
LREVRQDPFASTLGKGRMQVRLIKQLAKLVHEIVYIAFPEHQPGVPDHMWYFATV